MQIQEAQKPQIHAQGEAYKRPQAVKRVQISIVGEHLTRDVLPQLKRACKRKTSINLIPVASQTMCLPVEGSDEKISMPVLCFDLGNGIRGIMPAVETDYMAWTLPPAAESAIAADPAIDTEAAVVAEPAAIPASAQAIPFVLPDNIPVFPGKVYPTEKVVWIDEPTEITSTDPTDSETPAPGVVPVYDIKSALANRWRSLSHRDQPRISSLMIQAIGIPMDVRVLAIDEATGIAYLSRWALVAEQAHKTWANLAVGQEHPVTVVTLFRGGAHCNLGGIPVYLPIAQVAHTFITDITEYLRAGSVYMAKVIDIGHDTGVIAVSTKALAPDPWDNIGEYHQRGTHCLGVVTKINPNNTCLVRLQSGLTATAPIPAFMSVRVGDKVRLSIVSINPARRHIEGRINSVI